MTDGPAGGRPVGRGPAGGSPVGSGPDGDGPARAGAPPASSARRELAVALVLGAVAGGLALMTSGQTWIAVRVTPLPPLPPSVGGLTGGQAVPLVPATGLLLLAAAVALLAVRGAGRLLVGAVTGLGGLVLGWSALRVLAGAVPVRPGDLSTVTGEAGAELDPSVHHAWPVLALVSAVLALAAAAVVLVRGRRWPGLGRRYERTGGAGPPAPRRPETDEDRHQAAWRALDRGEDPTA